MVEINLLPWRELKRKQRQHIMLSYLGIISVIFIFLWVARVGLMHQLQLRQIAYQEKLSHVPRKNSPKSSVSSRMIVATHKQNIIMDIFNCILGIKESVFISDVVYAKKNILVKGKSHSVFEIKQFMNDLLSIENMDFVKMVYLSQQEKLYQFQLQVSER